eukprot:Rmarinus@m.2751
MDPAIPPRFTPSGHSWSDIPVKPHFFRAARTKSCNRTESLSSLCEKPQSSRSSESLARQVVSPLLTEALVNYGMGTDSSIELKVFNDTGFAGGDHVFVRSGRCRPDLMIAFQKLQIRYPLVLAEIVSNYEQKSPTLQLELKLLSQLCLAAKLSCIADSAEPCPSFVWGIVVPGWSVDGNFYKVKVEWLPFYYTFKSTSEVFHPCNINDLMLAICDVLDKNRPIAHYFRDYLQHNGPTEVGAYREIYPLNRFQRNQLNIALGGDVQGTDLVQFPANEALIFARGKWDGARFSASRFFKSSPQLECACVMVFNAPPSAREALVLPVDNRGTKTMPPNGSTGRLFFEFPTHKPFGKGELLRRFPDVVSCLKILHEAELAHCDVRRENLVTVESGAVRLIDLDRIVRADMLTKHSLPHWSLDMMCSGLELDWYQLGVSLLRTCCINDDGDISASVVNNAVQAAQSWEEGRFVYQRLLHRLLIECTSPDVEDLIVWPQQQEMILQQIRNDFLS